MLEAWHFRSLWCILGVTWRDRLTYEERRTRCSSLESQLGRRHLRWMGHVIRMEEDFLQNQIFYGDLSTGQRRTGGQRKCHKDIKTVLNKFVIAPGMRERHAIDRIGCRMKCQASVSKCEQNSCGSEKSKRVTWRWRLPLKHLRQGLSLPYRSSEPPVSPPT